MPGPGIQRFEGTARQEEPRVFKDLGLMRAKVVYNNDPKQLGRVRVQIPSLHGDETFEEYLKPEECPWAWPCVPGGCGQDMGAMVVPLPGTFVWVMFEDNDTNKPVYLGGCPSAPSAQGRPMNNLSSEDSPLQKWSTTPGRSEIPDDQWKGKSTGVPQRHILYKSQKGHTIMMDDTDGEEKLVITDRCGQSMVFKCPVSVGDNAANATPRGTASAFEDKQLDQAISPSIAFRSGATKDKHIATQYEVFQDHVDIFCQNQDSGQKTITQFTPISFLQQTKDSLMEMLEESIRIEFPDSIQFFDENGWSMTSFEKARLEFREDHVKLFFGDAFIQMTEEGIELNFNGSVIKLIEGKITIESEEIEFSGTKVTGKGGSSSLEVSDEKVQLSGSEIHFN